MSFNLQWKGTGILCPYDGLELVFGVYRVGELLLGYEF
jgi:hypothetical protein